MMHEAKVNVLAKPHPYVFFTLQLDSSSYPCMQLLMLCRSIYILITMTSLQLTQAQGLGCTRGMYRVPLSIQTNDSVVNNMI